MNGSFSFQSDLSGAADGNPGGGLTGGGGGDGGGLGSLADELAGEWDEDEEGEEEDAGFSEGEDEEYLQQAREESIPVPASSPAPTGSAKLRGANGLSPPKESHSTKHKRAESVYDGSDYGDDSDLEPSDGISPSLEARMAQIESLARRGVEKNGGVQDDVIDRVIAGLRDLGGQAGVEAGATRYG